MRRFLQFRLRSLFVVLTLAALLAWQVPPAVERYREKQRQIAAEKLAAQQRAAMQLRVQVAITWLETFSVDDLVVESSILFPAPENPTNDSPTQSPAP